MNTYFHYKVACRKSKKNNSHTCYSNALTMLSVIQALLFTLLTWWVRNHRINPIELEIGRALVKDRPHFVRDVIIVVSNLTCSPLMLNICTIPVVLTFWRRHLTVEAVMTGVSTIMSILLREIVRRIVHRPRPGPFISPYHHHKQSAGFPRGHVTTSVTFWGWFMVVGKRLLPAHSFWQKILTPVATLFIVLSGLTRISLGEHWISDVLGGYLFGGSILTLSLRVYGLLKSKNA